MSSAIYASETEYFSIQSDAYEIEWVDSDKDLESDYGIVSYKYNEGVFDDSWYEIGLVRKSKKGIPPIQSITYQSNENRSGFGVNSKVVNEFLSWFFSGSWIWSLDQRKFISFDEFANSKDSFLDFLNLGISVKGECLPLIVFHSPTTELLKSFSDLNSKENGSFDLYSFGGVEKLKYILSLMDKCEFLSSWNIGFESATLFSKNMEQVLDKIKEVCQNNEMDFIISEKLPSW